ncbi:protein of unknown function DUF4366 [Pseudobacteroides cellulosolvens ATCC 35603 = DSM 2933]|uniref:CBM-cenC domain-containing protein n=2 Tax=Pseudobacteroides cellulosolvens TaxID=35825 RepID=A0A0L6JS04_9FIRM|nr:protein of unknown function DUF4366 [Pseudobacteroides cellulosolvens ATCC 35603 = DSM 2933]
MLKKGIILISIISVLFAATAFIAYGDEGNILKNPGFEEVSGQLPANWAPDVYLKDADAGKVSVEDGKGRSNSKALVIRNTKLNDSKVFQDVQVQPGKIYKISSWIKAEGILNKAGSANLTLLNGKGIHTSVEYSDTKNDWKELSLYIKMTDSDNLKVGCRLGGQGTTNEGTAYFDDMSVELINEVPQGVVVNEFLIPGSDSSNSEKSSSTTEEKKSSGSFKIVLIILLIIAVLGALMYAEIKYSKKAAKNGDASENDKADNKKDKKTEETEEEFDEEDYDE